MSSQPQRSSAWCVYFVVGAKHGIGQLQIEHRLVGQVVWIPAYPDEGVSEAFPLLEPEVAHYASYWPRIALSEEEREDGFSRGFFVEANQRPPRLTDPANEPKLTEIARRVWPRHAVGAFGDHLRGLTLSEPGQTVHSNVD